MIDALVLWTRLDRVDTQLAGSGRDDGSATYLLIGSDRRRDIPDEDVERFGTAEEVPGERADIVILVHRDDEGDVRTMSIPRDLVLFRTDRGPERLAPMLQDGPGAIADAICNSLGIGVDHLAVIRFAGLESLIDLAGGVTIAPSAVFLDRGSGLLVKGGIQTVDGRTALAYVRARHIERREGDKWVPDPTESARRTERSVEVLRGLAPAIAPRANLWFDQRLAWRLTGAVTVDDGADIGDLHDIGSTLRSLDRNAIESLPVDLTDGDVPIATVQPTAKAALAEFVGTDEPSPECAPPVLLSGP